MQLENTIRPTPRSAFLAGLGAVAPLLLGVVPFGLVYGAAAMAAGLSAGMAQSMSAILFAGSSQFVVTRLVVQHTPALILLLIVALINLRHVLYSASIAPYLQHLPRPWKWGLAYLLTDEAYAVSIIHYADHADAPHKQWYLLGAGLGLWTTWQTSTAGGVVLGAALPASWSLDFALPLTFIALVVPVLKDRANGAAALVAGVVAVVAAGLPHNLGLVVAIVLGMGAGLLLDEGQSG